MCLAAECEEEKKLVNRLFVETFPAGVVAA